MTSTQLPVGIDLGTTCSVVAYLDTSQRPVTLPNTAGELVTPSAVLFDADGVVVGREAVRGSVMYFDLYAESFKRDMGSDFYRREFRNERVPPEVLSAFVLERLKQDTEEKLGPIHDVVITVPAFFDEVRRKTTQDAGRLAGLNVLDIINEPTAAAVAYAHEQTQLGSLADRGKSRERILVYDLGGGTFDVTILEIDDRRFRTVATDGDVQLGGRDFDERIVDFIAERFLEQHGIDPRSDPEDAAQLWFDASEAKHALTERNKTTVVCYHAGLRSRVEITRCEFEQLTVDLLERTESTTSLLIRQAGLDWSKIDRALLVGGASRMPMVTEMMMRVTGSKPDRSLSADEAVAHGAAIYCGMLCQDGTQKSCGHDFINVNSHSLGVVGIDQKSGLKLNHVLIPRNTPLPACVTRQFRTARQDQRSVSVPVVEGESHRPEDCIKLGHCVIKDLPAGLPRNTPVEVQYRYSSDGRISVSARVPVTRHSASVEIQRSRGMSLGDLNSWRERLCGLPQERVGPLLDNATREQASSTWSQLDELYVQLGHDVLNHNNLPPELHQKRLQAEEAMDQHRVVEQQLRSLDVSGSRAVGSAEAIRQSAELSSLRRNHTECEQNVRLMLLRLGRMSTEMDIDMPTRTRELERIKELESCSSPSPNP